MSDCEELVGLLTGDEWGWFLGYYSLESTPVSWIDVPEVLEVQVIPSVEVEINPEKPTATKILFP